MALQDAAQVAQHGVTRFVTKGVVEVLEMIDVYHNQRERQVLAFKACEFAVEGFLEKAPVYSPVRGSRTDCWRSVSRSRRLESASAICSATAVASCCFASLNAAMVPSAAGGA